MTSRQLRLVRGAAASSIATIIAAVSHTIGGGTAPHPLLIVALSVFITPIAALLIGSRPSLVRLGATVLLSQTVFHTLFVALNATVTPTIAGHNHVLALGPVTATVAPDAGMLGAHVIAAVFTIVLLWRGESILRAIARWVRSALRARVPHLQATWPAPASIAVTARTIIKAIRVGDLSRRGPPVFSRG
ncbi:hypothetical protein ACTU6U_04885 [Microbacterium sp. A196]|uniref:hypothetical protein n=1 Tax=unclassified Microbacterium TaxID=2609290 RepID=UPI003FD4886B